MRIGFYAPLKPPTSSVPSGDRRVARLMMAALRAAGHDVELMSRFRSRDTLVVPDRARRLRRLGGNLAARLIRRLQARPAKRRPELWFTYHLYYKAPDWIGPAVSHALNIPYVVAETSHAPKRAVGPWADGHAAVELAIRHADRVIGLNTHDAACVRPLLSEPARYCQMRPFMAVAEMRDGMPDRSAMRVQLAANLDLPLDEPWLLAVGMMRRGDKEASYRVLAKAVAQLSDHSWRLLLIGDGEARPAIRRAFGVALGPMAPQRLRWQGAVSPERLRAFYAAADLFVWPAINESYGMALLEAQAAGLPAVAGRTGGVGDILRDGCTGLLTVSGDSAAFAKAVAVLLAEPGLRRAMAREALAVTAAEHDIGTATTALDAAFRGAVADRRSWPAALKIAG